MWRAEDNLRGWPSGAFHQKRSLIGQLCYVGQTSWLANSSHLLVFASCLTIDAIIGACHKTQVIWILEIWTQILTLVRQVLYGLNHLPNKEWSFGKKFCMHTEYRCLGRPELWIPMELELQAVVSCLTWVIGIQFGSSKRAVCVLSQWAITLPQESNF